MKIFEIQSQLTGEVIRRYDTIDEADQFIKFFQDKNDPIRVTVRDLSHLEVLTMQQFVDAIYSLEKVGVSRAAIGRALGVSRQTVRNWLENETGRIRPSQMLCLIDLTRAFLK